MSDTMNLFEEIVIEDGAEKKRGIPGATVVKAKATALASQIMAKIPTADAEFLDKIAESQKSVAALDDLIQEECGAELNDPTVAGFSEEEAKKILKSNQSNRSRRKSMKMTQSNYVELLTAAIAEWIIRTSCNMEKSAGGFGAGRAAMVINAETVAELEQDQEALGRAIRNVQSKKSTYKAKHADNPNFEQDPEWQELLEQEAMLKAVRKTQPAGRKGLSLKKALQYIFDGVGSTENLTKDESYDIINACRELSQGVYPQGYVDMVAAKQAEKAMESEVEEDIYEEL